MKNTSQSAGRPREFDEDVVLNTVVSLFWKKGYEGTGMADILTATGLSKGSIYKAFHSKHNLYLKSLEHYEELHVNSAINDLKVSKKPPIQRLDDFLSAPIRDISPQGKSKGCFLCNASADRADGDAQTRALVRRGFDKLAKALVVVVSEIKPNWSQTQNKQSAQMLLSIYSGFRIMARSGVEIEKLYAAKSGALLAFQ